MVQWLKDNIDNIRFSDSSSSRGNKAQDNVVQFNDFLIFLQTLDNLGIFEWEITYDTDWDGFSIDIEGNRVRNEFYKLNHLVLYKDVITLTNDFGNKHTIHEVFTRFKIQLQSNMFILKEVQLVRTLLTDKEASSSYYHSHCSLNGNPICNGVHVRWGNFCLGSSSFRNIFNLFNIRQINDNREINIEQYKQLFVEWLSSLCCESNVGGPHHRIMEINYTLLGITQVQKCNYLSQFINTILRLIQNKELDFNFEFKLADNNLLFSNVQQLKDVLNENKQLFTNNELTMFFAVYKDGQELTPKPDSLLIPNHATKPIIFKGREYYQRITHTKIDDLRTVMLNSSMSISNNLMANFKKEIENRIKLLNLLNNGEQ
jgi:hypothetical protein